MNHSDVGLKWPPKIKCAQTKRCSSQFQQILTDNSLAGAHRQHSIAHCSTFPMNSAWIVSDKAAVPNVKGRAVCHHSWFPFFVAVGMKMCLTNVSSHQMKMGVNCGKIVMECKLKSTWWPLKEFGSAPAAGPGHPEPPVRLPLPKRTLLVILTAPDRLAAPRAAR